MGDACSCFNQLKQTRRDFMRVGSLAGLGGLYQRIICFVRRNRIHDRREGASLDIRREFRLVLMVAGNH